MPGKLQITTFGGLLIQRDGQRVSGLVSRKVEALLVYIAHTKRAHPREVLAEMLWEKRSQDRSLGNLRVALTSLRRELEEYVVISRDTIAINPDADVYMDAFELEKSLAAGQIEKAVALYQGAFLEGFYLREAREFEEWASQERRRLERLALDALSTQVTLDLERGAFKVGIEHASQLLRLNPLREEAHHKMMLLLACSGRRSAALTQFEICQRVLMNELGVEPSPELQETYNLLVKGERPADIPEPAYRSLILGHAAQEDIAGGLAASDRLATALEQELGAGPSQQTALLVEQIRTGEPVMPAETGRGGKPRHNLPVEPSKFVGRENELEKIAALLAKSTCRLLTLVGPGGSGKSRVALRVAEKQIGSYRNGVCFISLAGIDSPELLPSVIITALDLESSGQSDPKEQLFNYLQNKEMLLVLDNFEQLRSGMDLLSEMLQQARHIRLLITSRERLNLQSEWVYPIEGLDFPENAGVNQVEQYSAVTLFVQTAQRVRANFVLNGRNKPCVARICMAVEGMPLAIELAAAWTRVISCREIAEEIERGLDFLRVNQPDLPERHRSVRATFEHSWRLLSEGERAVFSRLSVFRGGFERQSASQVARASLGTLTALVDKSLVQRHPDGRYRIHELLRQFASGELERSGETEATREQHLAYFLQLAKQAEPNMWRDQERVWLDRLDGELDNLRQALKWSLSPHSTLGIQAGMGIVVALEEFIKGRGHFKEAAEWLADLLAHPLAAEHPKIMANGLRLTAFLNWWVFGKHEEARHQFERSLAIAEEQGDPLILAEVLSFYGNFCDQVDHDLPLAEAYLERSLLLFRQLGNEPGVATVLRRLGIVSYFKPEHLKARSYFQESLQIFRALGNNSGIALALFCLGWGESRPGRFEEARGYLEDCLAIDRELSKNFGQVTVLMELGRLEFACGNITRAKTYYEEVLTVTCDFGMKKDQSEALILLGRLSFYQEDYPKALSYYQQGLAIAQELENDSNRCRALSSLGLLYLRQGNEWHAYQYLMEFLLLGKDLSLWEWMPPLIGMASLSAVRGEIQLAARLLGTADGVLELTHTSPRYFPSVYPDYERIKAQLRGQLDEGTFNRLAAEGRALAAEGMDRIIEFAVEEF